MKELELNCINKKYLDISNMLQKKPDEDIKYDVYNSFPLKIESIDYGYIKLADGSITKMFVATSEVDQFKCNSLYFSSDGLNWSYIDFPIIEATTSYNKIIIHNGSVYVIFDDMLRRLYDFDLENSTMQEVAIDGDVYDITLTKNKLYVLAYNGFYTISDDDELIDFVSISKDFPFERFIKSTSNELMIMGYAENYPVFILYDESGPHAIFCTTACEIQTAISYKDNIYCYTRDRRIITVFKTSIVGKSSYVEYAGYNWTGEVYYYNANFWIAYADYAEDQLYTYIAKSSNGLDFDVDVRIPHLTENDGKFAIAGNELMSNVLCIGAGDTYTMIPSINYFSYGKPVIYKNNNIHMSNSREITISDFNDIDNFKKYNITVYACDINGKVVENNIKYDISPRVVDGNIYFKIQEIEYDDPESIGICLYVMIYGIKDVC